LSKTNESIFNKTFNLKQSILILGSVCTLLGIAVYYLISNGALD